MDQLASRTKISLKILEALEAGDFSRIPSELFARNYIRSYANCLGLNPEEIIKKFLESTPGIYEDPARSQVPPQLCLKTPESRVRGQWLTHGWVLGTALIGSVVLYLMLVIYQRSLYPPDAPLQDITALSEVGLNGEVELAANLPGLNPSGVMPPHQRDAKDLVLIIEALERSWIMAHIDDSTVKEVLLQPGEEVRWEAEDKFEVTVGNAGGVKLEFNGKDLGPLGPSGKVVKNILLTR